MAHNLLKVEYQRYVVNKTNCMKSTSALFGYLMVSGYQACERIFCSSDTFDILSGVSDEIVGCGIVM